MMTRIFTILVTVTGIITVVTGVASFYVSQAQELTPEEKAAMCDPNNPRKMTDDDMKSTRKCVF